jgi:hypothetical protein
MTPARFFFNMLRPNFSKGGKTPWEILSEDRPDISPDVLLFPVVDIDALFMFKFSMPSGGQITPAFAALGLAYLAAVLRKEGHEVLKDSS